MSDLILFWHRRDLRASDNLGLSKARERSPKVVGVFCLDPLILDRDDVAPARVKYLIGSLESLQEKYAAAGSELLIIQADPKEGIPKLARSISAKAVFLNQDVEPYGRDRDQAVIDALNESGIEVQRFWDQLLHSPEDIKSGTGSPYTVYSPFWKNWSSRSKASPVADLAGAEGLTDAEREQAAGIIPLPSAKDLGYVWDNALMLDPGEQAAQERLEEFCASAIYEYQQQRNFPAQPGTSLLSAALKFGVIGVRTVWAATVEAAEHRGETDDIRVWRQEIAWREFYQHAMYHFPELAEGAYRPVLKTFPWDNNEKYFQAWCEGRTGYPIIDAAIRQMNETAWMHNRCRMITASFLTKDLFVDYRLGEKYFMQRLYDGDLSSNNGGWQWSTSSGMDPKPLRIFNPASQAKKFDAEAEYIREWLPELRSVETEDLISGKISLEERDRAGYPRPIIDHNVQQRKFKERFAAQKAATGDGGGD
ncbi:FAD-binding domain-containing protein [Leptolyngbya sp. FACHB-17]|uniref:FAD-binding domain-containing protein n=1 Tax=unclassified Leptolyngbya TaxID=2650499 RepID=UPI0016811790|nr:FAD-binding domain-containing protein [Leptolyngbya sp. FACHB-17]MBD2081441.1 deoxyribodipyrimidine photo-lyase [Leptolyngbya sp. FACHB-17]